MRAKTVELHEYRTQLESKQWETTTLYNKFYNEPSSKLYKLHEQLDKLVMEAYKFKPENDILEQLLKLNQQLGDKESQNQQVIGPHPAN